MAGFALALGSLVGCGGDDGDGGGTPANASKEDFCANFESLMTDLQGMDPTKDLSEAVDRIQEAGDQMEETGTPADMPDDARAGFQFVLDTVGDIDDNASIEDLAKLGSDMSSSEKDESKAFNDYLEETCDIS